MPGRIQTPPFGFLSALGLKSSGSQPPAVATDLVPSYETGGYYDASKLETASNGAAMAGAGSSVDLEVPAGEAWKLIGAQYGVIPSAGSPSVGSFALLIIWNNASIRIATETPNKVIASALSEQQFGAVLFPRDVVLLPGARLRARYENGNSITGTINVGCVYTKLEI